MRLKKLEIHGFKSFADRVEMTFNQGITGIVGPNGCGKSNLSDAVRWVLGEQSAKQLRGAKMEDIIFNGTEKRRRSSFCEVTLVFENDDHALPVDFVEVGVTRRVYRTGESEYRLNGTPCRLKDIVDQFRDTGIGKDGYSIIGQGRVDEILSSKAEDRRQIFEEAAGIVKFKARKTEAEARLGTTRVNLSRVEDILAEMAARIEPLRAQSEQARTYLALRDELKGLELTAFLVRSDRYQARLAELTTSLQALTDALAAGEQERVQWSDQRAALQDQLADREARAAAARDDVQALIRDTEACEGAVGIARERIQATQREQTRMAAEWEAAKEGRGGVQRRIAERESAATAIAARVQAAREVWQNREAALQTAEQSTDALEAQAEAAKERVIQAINRLSDVRSEQARLQALQDAAQAQLDALSADQATDEATATALARAVADAEAVWRQETARKAALDAQAEALSTRLRALVEAMEADAAQTRRQEDERKALASRLNLLNEMQRDYEGYYQSVKQVLTEARRTGASGVHGVVAQLIRVPQRLERAIDMVLGNALQHIVVDRDEDAKRMIEFLRRNRYGRATFLPIHAVHGRSMEARERRLLTMPGCVGLAAELVDFDPIYRGIVESLLGRTLVAENLDQGIAIQRAGNYQFRLVTLDGDVMHSGGSMTGGSVQSRMTSLLSREREITEGTQTLRLLTDQVDQANAARQQQEQLRDALQRQCAEANEAIRQQEIACARAEAHVAKARDEHVGHRARAQKSEQARVQLREQLAEMAAQLSALDGEKASQEGSNDDLRDAARRASQAAHAARVAAEALRQQAADDRVALTGLEHEWEEAQRDVRRLAGQADDIERMSARTERALAECQAKCQADEAQLQSDEVRLAEKRTALEGARAAFERIDSERKDQQAQLRHVNEALEGVRARMDEHTDTYHRTELTRTRVEAEWNQLTSRIWADYELTYDGAQAFRQTDVTITAAEKRIAAIRGIIREMGVVNVASVDEYRQTVERYEALGTQREDLVKAQTDLEGIIESLARKMEALFVAQFNQLNAYFQQTFVQLFGGGHAELRLEDPNDALHTGIEIVAQPPGKKLQLLSLLSGGERALTAIAILFAMLKVKPTPFCFLDEIEAALDDANIDHFANYLKTYSDRTQFVVVTHRKGTMECCDALYGVAMEEKGVTRLMSVQLTEAERVLSEAT